MSEPASETPPAVPPFQYTPPPSNCIAFATIPVKDCTRAKAFYEKIFGWQFWTAPGSSVTVFRTGGDVMGTLSTVEAPAHWGTSTDRDAMDSATITLYVRVDDVDATLKTIVESGGEVVKPKWTDSGHIELALYKDTEGNVGGLLRWLI